MIPDGRVDDMIDEDGNVGPLLELMVSERWAEKRASLLRKNTTLSTNSSKSGKLVQTVCDECMLFPCYNPKPVLELDFFEDTAIIPFNQTFSLALLHKGDEIYTQKEVKLE